MNKSLFAAVLAASTPAWAQPSPNSVVITGNPLASTDVATPSSVLTGNGLVLRRGSSLGETLDGLPGVASSYFGPNANRPVIRGQDGDRIRVLSNAGASLDASSLSFDHAVPIDPLVVERIEVLRGPAALLYGGSAVGGVVNAIDNRIPKAALEGVSGAVEARFGGAARERAVAALVEAGGSGFAVHADAFKRSTDNLRVPAFERPLGDGSSQRRTQLVNSASRAEGGALGASHVWANGHVGLGIDSYRNNYGIVAEDDIRIQMRRDKLALASEWRLTEGPISVVRAQAASTDYQHQEIEGDGSVGTTFKTRGSDGRFELVHQTLQTAAGNVDGTLGMQFETSRFSALGEEAFVPTTRTRQAAAFVLQRLSWGELGHISAGLRLEQVRVNSDGDAGSGTEQFGPTQDRRFSPRSAALSAVFNLNKAWQLSSSLAYTERAPTSYELYANGVHAATSAYERGDAQQAAERGRNVDVAATWRDGPNRVKVSLFDSRFANYIALTASGEPDFEDDAGDSFPVFVFKGVRARLHGLEAEATWRVMTRGASSVDVDAKLDWVRGQDLSTGEALPRLPPQRMVLGLNVVHGDLTARIEGQHASAQRRVPSTDVVTPGWTMLNLSASYAWRLLERELLLFAKLYNAGNTLAYSASTIGTVRPLAPLPGRALTLGARLAF